jgi:hypothetical protein
VAAPWVRPSIAVCLALTALSSHGSAVASPGTTGGSAVVERLPLPPLAVRGDAAVVWNGSEVVVWGGDVEAINMGLPGPDRNFSDGAAFDPQIRSWRRLARSPLSRVGVPSTATNSVGAPTARGAVFARGHHVALWQSAGTPDGGCRTLLDRSTISPRPANGL